MSDKPVSEPIDRPTPSRPGIISLVVMGVIIAVFVFFIFLH